ncbi:hypothetical protein GCM10027277_01130 [Pseudoduganella ginsengisoli]|uniref:DUF1360 domain-containing protein n=1 Tax=Pseudoduganella ginsengisoli TaxID=1462440 RepID=A0A6L6Q9X4_9BURK|nr:DUF1360 domain-containing protein [Pseudoduganella ginsengisoli]MTW06226.1 DUF1360 domain-containing protein [Pseudoduganella ginsengisoli]
MTLWYELVLALFGTWRVCHLLHAEDGPWDSIAALRRWAGDSAAGRAMDCFFCLSLWVAAPFAIALATDSRHGLLLWLALSGAAILLEAGRTALLHKEN